MKGMKGTKYDWRLAGAGEDGLLIDFYQYPYRHQPIYQSVYRPNESYSLMEVAQFIGKLWEYQQMVTKK